MHVRQVRCILETRQALILNFLQSRQITTFYGCIKDWTKERIKGFAKIISTNA